MLAPIIILFVSLPYSQKARNKYKILKFADGRKHIILILVAVVLFFNLIVEHYTGTNPATKKDVREAVQNLEQSNEKIWNKALSAIKEEKWPLQASWDLDDFSLIDKKIQIVILADETMWYQRNGGDYASYLKLWSLRDHKDFPQSFIEDQLQRVNSVLRLANSTVRRIPLCKHGKNIDNRCLEMETEEDFEVKNVVSQLSHPQYWVSRVKSAYLLHFLTPEKMQKSGISWETVLDALYVAFSGANEIHKNDNLLVRYMAWESFRKYTCFADEKALLDIKKASEWWEDKANRQKVLNALESGQKSPFCGN